MFVLSIPIRLMRVHDSTTTFFSLLQHADDGNAALLVIQRNFGRGDVENSGYSLPLYLGIQRTDGGRPLMLKCFPSN